MAKKDIFKNVDKEWYKSKTIYIAIVGLILAVCSAMGIQIPDYVYLLLLSSGLITARDASGLIYKIPFKK